MPSRFVDENMSIGTKQLLGSLKRAGEAQVHQPWNGMLQLHLSKTAAFRGRKLGSVYIRLSVLGVSHRCLLMCAGLDEACDEFIVLLRCTLPVPHRGPKLARKEGTHMLRCLHIYHLCDVHLARVICIEQLEDLPTAGLCVLGHEIRTSLSRS